MFDTMITPTQESLDIVQWISGTLLTFHHHYHILYDVARMFPGHVDYLEIGAFHGASAALMLQRPDTSVITIDNGEYVKQEEVERNVGWFNTHHNKFQYVLGDSHQLVTKNRVVELLPDGVDILFIDADHSENGVFIDFSLYHRIVRLGGFLVFDDYNDAQYNPQVHWVVDKIVAGLEDFKIIGTIKNHLKALPEDITEGNCFIIQRIWTEK
jgi:predicted O-methyltransferase YrrM